MGEVRVLDDVSFDLSQGEIVDVVGPSGAGKTTLLRALARLMPSASGSLTLSGVVEEDAQAWRSRVGLVPQKAAAVRGSVRENVLLPWTLRVRSHLTPPSDSLLRRALDEVGLADVALDRDISRLSVGQQSRVALVRVLLTQPAVLLLDEPDAALDDASSAALRATLSRFAAAGGAIVRVRHRADDGLADRRLRLEAGRLEEVTS